MINQPSHRLTESRTILPIDIVLVACDNDGNALQHASVELRDDVEVCGVAVTRCARALAFAGELPRADKGLVVAAVAAYGYSLRWASAALRDDRDVRN